jgi:hypothetical protein
VQPSDESGDGIAPVGNAPPLVQVSSYCEPVQSGVQVSVPPLTPPSASNIAPLLTSQMLFGIEGRQPTADASSYVFAFAGY